LLLYCKTDLTKVFKKVYQSLKKEGIFYISLKMRDNYTEEIKKDEYGERMFYYYNPEIIKKISNDKFSPIYLEHKKNGETEWFDIALKKN